MTLRLHAFAEASAFERSLSLYDEQIRKGLALLARGEGDAQAICRHSVRFSIWNACIALILHRGDAEALRYFRQALAYGLLKLGAPGSKKGLRAYDVLMEVGEEGSRIIHEHERRSAREPRMLSVADYSSVLTMAICFGERSEMEEVMRFPEERYRNPNVVVGEDYYGYLRGWKQLVLGDERSAKRSMEEARSLNTNPRVAPDMAAFVHLLDGDRAGFLRSVEERLQTHKKQYQKEPGNPEGFVCFPGLMLCRMAIDHGMPVEDAPYLPVRLLPNYHPVVH
jgi:hypothetical protein